MFKICPCCKAEKPLDGFYKDKRRPDGLYSNCKDCAKLASKKWKEANPQKAAKSTIKSREKESSKQSARDRAMKWRENNPGYSAKYHAARKRIDPMFRLVTSVRNLLLWSFKAKGYKKKTKTEQLLGCSTEQFKKHIEKQFLDGMSWDNRDQWHIDHITPICVAKTEAEIIALSHHTNLRPLWAKDNLAKNGTVSYLI